MQDLIICSVGVHALEMAEIVERINRERPTWNLLGYAAEEKRLASCEGATLNGYPVLGSLAGLARYPDARLAVGNEFKDLFPLDRAATLVDPSCFVSRTARLGRGCVVYPGCTIGHNAVLGDRVFMLSGCIVNHDDVLEDGVVLASGVALAGAVHVEAGSYLGQSCTVRQYLRIGAGSLVGMGAVVVDAVPPGCVVVGNPARVLRTKS